MNMRLRKKIIFYEIFINFKRKMVTGAEILDNLRLKYIKNF